MLHKRMDVAQLARVSDLGSDEYVKLYACKCIVYAHVPMPVSRGRVLRSMTRLFSLRLSFSK